MLGIFKRKTKKERLEFQYKKLMAEAHTLSHRDRKASDAKLAQAEALAVELERL